MAVTLNKCAYWLVSGIQLRHINDRKYLRVYSDLDDLEAMEIDPGASRSSRKGLE